MEHTLIKACMLMGQSTSTKSFKLERNFPERTRGGLHLWRSAECTWQRGPLHARKVGKTSQPAQAFSNNCLFTVWGSHIAQQVERPFEIHKMITSVLIVGKPSAININLSTVRKSTLKKSFMSLGNVGRSSLETPTLTSTRKSTLKPGFLSTWTVTYSIHKYWASVITREFTPGRGLLSAASVGRPSLDCPNSLLTRKSTLQKDLWLQWLWEIL